MMLLPILFLTIFSLNCFKSKYEKECDCYNILFKEIDKMIKYAKRNSELVKKLNNFKYQMVLLRENDDRKNKDMAKKIKNEILSEFELKYCNIFKRKYNTKKFEEFSDTLFSFLNETVN